MFSKRRRTKWLLVSEYVFVLCPFLWLKFLLFVFVSVSEKEVRQWWVESVASPVSAMVSAAYHTSFPSGRTQWRYVSTYAIQHCFKSNDTWRTWVSHSGIFCSPLQVNGRFGEHVATIFRVHVNLLLDFSALKIGGGVFRRNVVWFLTNCMT